jgi:hypothetical protein
VIIEARFNGPPESGNGGYTAGLVARALGAERSGAVVTLRQPPPLDTPLRVVTGTGGITVYAGDHLVAEGAGATLDDEAVPPVSYDEATGAAVAYRGFTDHPFPTCYVCGPKRPGSDGLRIFPGPLPDGRTAAPWSVPPEVSAVTMWAALDCPGGWSVIAVNRPYVLGRITARVDAVPPPGAQCVVAGAMIGSEDRKAEVRTAVYAPDGGLLAQARCTWIAVPVGAGPPH